MAKINLWVMGAYWGDKAYSRRAHFKAWHVPQRLINKRHNFLNQLTRNHKGPFQFFIIIMKVAFASVALSMVKGSNTVQQLFCESFLEIR